MTRPSRASGTSDRRDSPSASVVPATLQWQGDMPGSRAERRAALRAIFERVTDELSTAGREPPITIDLETVSALSQSVQGEVKVRALPRLQKHLKAQGFALNPVVEEYVL